MKIMRKFLIATAGVLVLLATGCGNSGSADNDSGSTSTSGGTSGELTIEVIAKGFTQQYWTAVNRGADEAAEELSANINFVGPANETAIQEQVQMLSNGINKAPDAIALASLDTSSQIDLLEQAKNSGIPIIGFDSGVPEAPEGTVLATAATNNQSAAAIAAEKIFETISSRLENASSENPVRVGVLSQEVNSQSISERTEGFLAEFEELAGALENIGDSISVTGHEKFSNGVSSNDSALILQVQVPAAATDTEMQTTAQALLNQEDLAAVFASNETASKGLINANNAVGNVLGESGVIAAGFDSGKLQKEAVRDGDFIGSVTQDPITIGYKAVELAVKAANGEEVEDLDVPAAWYDAQNIDSDEIAPLLYD